jgi:hypothetical protein
MRAGGDTGVNGSGFHAGAAGRVRWWAVAAAVACGLLAAGRAQADTIFLEAEGGGHEGRPLSSNEARITSPFQIKDDPAASLGRYLTVAPGNNSQTAPPAVEGVATYRFGVGVGGNYRIWGRVITPTRNDDSFWVRVRKVGATTSTLVAWNDIDPGTSWHWAPVIADGSTTAKVFALETDAQYDLQISYREDGAKLDMLVITSETTFNPKAPPKTAPPLPEGASFDAPIVVPRKLTAGAQTGIRLFWSEVPGAKSYTVTRSTSDGETRTTLPTVTGITTHQFVETKFPTNGASNCYDVAAIFSDGTSRQLPFDQSICEERSYERTFLDTSTTFTGSAPMVVDDENNGAFTAAGTPESLNAPPAHGRLRFDFAVGGSAKLQLWFTMGIPDKEHDSFWARMDDGAWIKWNNIPQGCSPVSNSDAGGARVTFNVAAGTHRFELATRETGVVAGSPAPQLSNILFITDNLAATGRLCDD